MFGVLLTNLGTPAAPTASALKTYLAEFLSDPRVVEIPRVLWQPILHAFVLRTRPKKSAKLYKKIWSEEGSPLLMHSQQLANKLQSALADQNVLVALGMRYGTPSIAQALHQLREKNVTCILILPLYPQYSAATTASTFDAVSNALKHWRVIPDIHLITHYHDNPLYISALVKQIYDYWENHGKESHLLFSFHGLPKRCIKLGDPYEQQCYITAQLVAKELHLSEKNYSIVFQSRFGKAEWLQPYCDKTLQAMPAQGKKKVTVICPGFSVDCLETLEEIAQQNRDLFLKAGGEKFDYIPALNDSDGQIALLKDLIDKNFAL